ncbi:MAG TPA: hypothetical protein VIA06_10855 [Candidatus Dormibacteraeota bacterium]|jgi:hypothetical protein|nr:hypothetical protein [Candidatus Dormibacteraeota bacterium]
MQPAASSGDPGFDVEMAAASIRAESGDLDTFMEALAAKLEGALPGFVEVDRGGGLFRRKHGATALAVTLEERHYTLQRTRHGVTATSSKAVRGITLKTEEMGLEAWVDALVKDLADYAQRHVEARRALSRLVE